MSKEEAVLEPDVQPEAAVGEQRDTAGAMLREGRQSQDLDIATLAAMLKVPVHKLQALEQNQTELLADPVFARALASSMCRILKLDPAPVLHRLPAISAFNVTSQNRGINTPFRTRNGLNEFPWWSHISRPAILVGLVLLLGALVLVFLPSFQQLAAQFRQEGSLKGKTGQGQESSSATTTVTTLATPAFPSSSESAAMPGPAPSGVGTVDTPVSGQGAVTQQATVSPAIAEPLSADTTVAFSARQASNIKVTDASGLVVFDRVLRAGESASLSGKAPLGAVISRANAVQVQVRGQDFDLASVTKSNIARFEVK
ncbi:MAG: hypothetical protein JWR74_3039 [Polaromonas sp.]|nr:hypothetical protein [Polaromonas sp.]